jgi:sec-independent protein translocase protein TatC
MELHFFAPTEPFFVTLRISLISGMILAAPLILLETWSFIAPALTRAERRMVLPVLPVVLLLFAGGVAFVYYVLLPVSIGFLLGLAQPQITPLLGQQDYFGLVTALCLAGGLLFQLPAVLGLLGALGFVTPDWLWQNSGYALIVLMTLSAVITPTGDAFNMLVLTAPLMLLYILSIGVVWVVQQRHHKY